MQSRADIFVEDDIVSRSDKKEETFGCCSRYRLCSETGRCAIESEERSKGCAYRKKLESGKVFFGKNADKFDREIYADILNRITGLSAGAKAAFDNLIIIFAEYQRGTSYCIARKQYTDEMREIGLFDFENVGSEFVSGCAYKTFLQPAFEDIFKYAEGKKLTQEKLREWLNGKGKHIRDMAAETYCHVRKKAETNLYMEEYYCDFLSSGQAARIYSLSPFAEDGMLSQAEIRNEEARRIKLSHGYSEREKEELNAVIDERVSALMKKGAEAAETIRCSLEDPFRDKTFVITGVLKNMERKKALEAVIARGGKAADTPVSRMDCLVVGHQKWSERNEGIASRKIQKAIELQEQGKKVKIISEDEFFDMLEKPPLKIEQ